MRAIVPGIGEASESIFPEALADERLVYYPFLNNALGVVNALGVAGCVRRARAARRPARAARARARARAGATRRRCSTACSTTSAGRARRNLRTRLHDLDELVGDIATQSVYVTIANPLRGAGA